VRPRKSTTSHLSHLPVEDQLKQLRAHLEKAESRARVAEKLNDDLLKNNDRLEDELKQVKKEVDRLKGNALEACTIEELIALEKELGDVRERIIAARIAKTKQAELECTICYNKPRELAFRPCGHIVCCRECSNNLPVCPICRTAIRKRTRIIIA